LTTLPATHTVQFVALIGLGVLAVVGATVALNFVLRDQRKSRPTKMNAVLDSVSLVAIGFALMLAAIWNAYGTPATNLYNTSILLLIGICGLLRFIAIMRRFVAKA
jgi:RsiW-degrading membrane proteinase PrsW (M82 family)